MFLSLKAADHSATTSNLSPLILEPRVIVALSIAATVLLALAGMASDICLGDENTHVRNVQAMIATGGRVAFDPLYPPPGQRIIFFGTPLWHAGLAGLWKAFGTSQVVTQLYHAVFYLLLVLSIYFAARAALGPAAASWAWLLVATTPMVCAYSILLYQDVPGVALSALAILLLWRKRFFWSGVVFAVAYLTKMNMLSFAPWAVLFALAWAAGSWKKRLSAAALVCLPIAAAVVYDFAWQWSMYGPSWARAATIQSAGLPSQAVQALATNPGDYRLWKPYAIYQPTGLISNFGVPLLLALVAAALWAHDRLSRWLWLSAALTVAGFVCVFVIYAKCMQTRYLFPLVPVAALLGGKALGRLRLARWLAIGVVSLCALQALVAIAFTYQKRHITPDEAVAYAWIREHTDPTMRIMEPEEIVTNQAGRATSWLDINAPYLLSEMPDRERQEILSYYRVSHIAVPLRRVYDRAAEGCHGGGYPSDFLTKAGQLPYLKKVFANPGFVIFEVMPPPDGPPLSALRPQSRRAGTGGPHRGPAGQRRTPA